MDREAFCVLFLDNRHRIRGKQIVSVGSLNASLAEPREVFKGAILASAAAIITAHNHPSGDVHPSDDDERLWERLTKAGKLLGIAVLDHLIVGPDDPVWSSSSGFARAGEP